MDLKVSRKEQRLLPSGPVEVLVSNVFDIYPVFDNVDPNLIIDCEMLDDARTELLDRSMFAVVKQRGADPVEPESGIQWAEAVIGEVSAPTLITQITNEVNQEGPGVRASFSTALDANGKENFQVNVSLTGKV